MVILSTRVRDKFALKGDYCNGVAYGQIFSLSNNEGGSGIVHLVSTAIPALMSSDSVKHFYKFCVIFRTQKYYHFSSLSRCVMSLRTLKGLYCD